MALKAARHLVLQPPARTPGAIIAFFERHQADYVALRQRRAGHC
jgi:hypothetical protein